MAHPPLQPRRRFREAGPGSEAADPGGGEARLANPKHEPARIELRLRLLAQLFHSFDPSPFRERELDATAEEFIVGWASELPSRAELELVVHLEEKRPEAKDELDAMVAEAVRNHFAYRAASKQREYRALLGRGRRSLAVGLAFLALCFLAGQALNQFVESPLAQLGRESLLIGGWVAMWRPLEIFLYDRWVVRRQEREYERLTHLRVHVDCPRV
jgi:hypothetical protein